MAQRYRLDNGLTVVFDQQHAAKVAAFQVWVNAGSADERPDEAGLAHLHEHMLFKGTARRRPGEIAREVEAHGGEINAWTSFDQTVYHIVVASQFAQRGVDILGDAMRSSVFDPAELSREVEVVCEEIRRSEDIPARRASRDLFATAYRVHPYQRPVIGTEQSVRGFTREKVLDFYRRHYSPSNMVLAAAGDFREAELRAWVEDYFGGNWERPDSGPRSRPQEPTGSPRRIHLRQDEVKEAYLNLAFAIPALQHADIPALDALAMLVGQGEASRLVLEVKRKRSLVNDIRAYAYSPTDPGLMVTSLTLPPQNAAAALEAATRILLQLRTSLVPPEELSTVKALIEAEAVYQREAVQGLARKLGFYQSAVGGIERESEYYERIAALTPENLLEMADRYLRLEGAVLTGLLPPGTSFGPAEADEILDRVGREAPSAPAERRLPVPQPPAPMRVATPLAARGNHSGVVIERLSSGATVMVREESAVPLFAVRAVFPGGVRYESEEDNGLTALLARMLTRGTPTHDAEQISHLVDSLSGSLSGHAGRNSMGLRGEFLSRHFHRAMMAFADCLLNPLFPESELQRERALILQDILAREDNPAGLAQDLLARALYRKHPYGLPTFGEQRSVERLGPEQLQQYHARYMDPSQLTLCVVGDVKVDQVLAFAQEAFGRSRGTAGPAPQVSPEPPMAEARSSKKTIQRAQSHLLLAFHGARVNDPWRHALEVLSTALSSQGGRLFTELRDKRSMAYSVSSFTVEGVDPGFFAVYMATSPQKVDAALEGIRAELTRIREEPLPELELRRARQHLIGTHEIGLQRNGARAALLALDQCYGLGLENFLHYAERVAGVTAEDVQAVARRVIDLERGALAVVGP